jgi:ABC-type sulfate/molybdate transport systems ATPase subunit
MTFLNVSNINKVGLGNFKLENISFLQSKNQKVALAGETGSGKSTLLKIIAGLEQPDEGEVLFREEHVHGPVETLVPGHPEIAYLSQEFELPKFLRVDQVLSYANKLSDEDARSLFEVCEISHLTERKTNELSGGEKQRIALAKLLIGSPQLLLLDEPFSNLDMIHKNTLKKVLNSICDELRITCILVSHDPLDTLSWADKIIVMKEGKIIQRGSPKKIYTKPLNEYVAGLFGSYNIFTGDQSLILGRTLDITSKNSAIIIRPENIKLTTKKKKSVEGKVRKIKYFGGYYELTIFIEAINAKVHIRQRKNDVKRGEHVYLRYSSLDLWPIR